MSINKEKLMRIVIHEAEEAIKEGNSPFGAILIDENGNIIEKAHNTAKSMCNPVLHAEINLITKACKKLNTRDLSKYCIMSNAWSCSMCMSACIKAKIQNFIYGAPSELDMNPNITIFDIKEKTNNKLNIEIGVLQDECQLQIENARQNTGYKV
ncbi:MAG: nucleoside deaminase [Clostridia bacterium]|nr:nucleoside deaminase [Clostridia bacterium]